MPQRGCRREKRCALAGVSGSPPRSRRSSCARRRGTRTRAAGRAAARAAAGSRGRSLVRSSALDSQNSNEEPSWSLIRLVSPTGIRKNSTIASASATTTVPTQTAARDLLRPRPPRPVRPASSGGSCALAETSSARKPIASEPPSATTPRMIGRRSTRWRLIAESSGKVLTSISPSAASSGERSPSASCSARRLAHRDRPVGDAAHHHALEHRLAAHGRVARGAQLAVGQLAPLGARSAPARRRRRRSPRRRRSRPARSASRRPDARTSRYLADRACACRRPLATRRWKRSTRPPVSISFCRPV